MEYTLDIHSSGSSELSFESAVAEIDALESRGWRLGLDRMAAFCEFAGLKDHLGGNGRPNFIHVAGTNGKGSTCAFVESLLRHSGLKTGAFYSPYVKDYRERVQSEGSLISKDDFVRITEELLAKNRQFSTSEYEGLTKFEFEAALGFAYWGELGCDWVALEVGLGGRLDATNVVRPSCSIIVSIGLDHTGILGETVEEIAAEKAGIIKEGVPVILGNLPSEADRVIEMIAHDRHSPVWKFGREIILSEVNHGFDVRTPQNEFTGIRPNLLGSMQPHNMALAIAALDVCGIPAKMETVRLGASAASIPGRFHRAVFQGADFIIDGAHNPDAAVQLVKTLDVLYLNKRPRVLVANTLSGHDGSSYYSKLSGHFESLEIAPIDSPRALNPEAASLIAQPFFNKIQTYGSVAEAIESAAAKAGTEGMVVVTGSNYLAGEVLNLIDEKSHN